MCGIAGYIGTQAVDQSLIQRSLARMDRRGPDHHASQILSAGNTFVCLLHSRLSIIDLDVRSNQPFEKEGLTLVFNGEIYNYLELRDQLGALGHTFSTNSDTEVLLEAYRAWGKDCTTHFEGMWAFALWDGRNRQLFVSRDRFGEKPLYIFQGDGGTYFASEIKILQQLANRSFEVNRGHLVRYVVTGHKSLYKTSETYHHGVSEFPIASSAIISANAPATLNAERFWVPTSVVQPMSIGEAIEGTRERLIESVRLRMRSDVPLAFCLSGGVDSAGLVSIASKVFNVQAQTFSIIDTDERYNELTNIQATIDDTGCASTKILLEPGDGNITRLEDIIAYHDAPIATISYFVHALLTESIAKGGFKISVSGTGADEIFTGYYDHFNLHLYEMRNHAKFNQLLSDWQEHVLTYVRHPDFRRHDLYFNSPDKREHIYLNSEVYNSFLHHPIDLTFAETRYTDSLLRNRMMNEMFHEVVRVILHEDDLNSMMYSIENRSPFLDKSLFEWAYSIPTEHLINEGYNKFILRSALKGLLNDQVRLTREKRGFNASINSIFDFSNPKHRDYFLSNSPVFEIFKREKIEQMLSLSAYPNSDKKFLFNFINVKIFLEQQAASKNQQ